MTRAKLKSILRLSKMHFASVKSLSVEVKTENEGNNS